SVCHLDHYHTAVIEHLWRLGPTVVPDDIVLDGIELGKRACLALGCCQYLVNVLVGYSVSHQRPFHYKLGTLAKPALTWKFPGVEKILDRGGPVGSDRLVVIGVYGAVNDFCHGTFAFESLRDEVLFGRGAVVPG